MSAYCKPSVDFLIHIIIYFILIMFKVNLNFLSFFNDRVHSKGRNIAYIGKPTTLCSNTVVGNINLGILNILDRRGQLED